MKIYIVLFPRKIVVEERKIFCRSIVKLRLILTCPLISKKK